MLWLVVVSAITLTAIAFYFAEIHGDDNKRAPRTPGATYDTRKMAYPRYLQTPEWQAIRQMALDRDGHRCVECGSTEQLQVHHKTYARRGHEKRRDLVTLCDRCHKARHRRRAK